MSNYSIKDLESLTGIKAHTIRIWEQRYGFIVPSRTETNIRRYSEEDLKMILNVALLRRSGLKISKIVEMSYEKICEKVVELTQTTNAAEDQIQLLMMAMVEFDEAKIEKIINHNLLKHGFENAMFKIVFPFFSKIGTLWMSGSINPAEEHFMTHLIKMKLMVALDSLQSNYDDRKEKFLFYLPAKEEHELSLLFAAYLVKKRGWPLIYLGPNLPFSDLLEAQKFYKADYIVTASISHPKKDRLKKYLQSLSTAFPKSQIMISGWEIPKYIPEEASNIKYITTMADFLEKIEEQIM